MSTAIAAPAPSTPASHYLTIDGRRLHYLTWGPPDGAPVVLLHGLRGHARNWERMAAYLAPPWRLLALDLRGHGSSDWSAEGYGTTRYVADLAAWVAAVGLERFDLIGHSAGGRVAVTFAAAHRALVRRLVVVDISPDIEFRPFDPELAAAPRRVFPDLAAVESALRRHYPTVSTAYLRWLAAQSVRSGTNGGLEWKWDQRVRGQPPPAEQFRASLRALMCPTLLVRGAARGYVSAEGAAAMQALVPDCRVAAIARAGHCVHEERPGTFANVVRAFLSEE